MPQIPAGTKVIIINQPFIDPGMKINIAGTKTAEAKT